MRKKILISIMTACACAGADGRLEGPGGLVADTASASIRTMYGVPGSAYVGGPVVEDVASASIAPSGRAALYVKDGSLVLLRDDAAVIAQGLNAARIAWSADSSAAAVLDAAGALRIWKTDGSASSLDAPAGIAALATDGSRVVAAAPGAIYLLEAGKSARTLAQTEGPAALVIAGADLFYADRARGEVRVLRNYANGGDPALIAKLEDVVGVGIARNIVVMASASQRKAIGLRDGSGEPLFDLALDFEPSGVDLFGDAAWLLNAGQSGPLQVLATDGEPAVYFIPRQ
jgi:hypothetical protein